MIKIIDDDNFFTLLDPKSIIAIEQSSNFGLTVYLNSGSTIDFHFDNKKQFNKLVFTLTESIKHINFDLRAQEIING